MPFFTLTGGNNDKIPGRAGRKALVVCMKAAGTAVYAGESPIATDDGIPFSAGVPVSFVSPDNKFFAQPLAVKGSPSTILTYTEFM
jgi:hypothetical protein